MKLRKASALLFAVALARAATAQDFAVRELSDASYVIADAEALFRAGRIADGLAKLRPLAGSAANRVVRVRRESATSTAAGGERAAVWKPATDGGIWFGVWSYLVRFVDSQPREVLEEMERIDGGAARIALESALAARDPEACVRVYREFPWTHAGSLAYQSAATFALERGHVEEAVAIMRRLASRTAFAGDAALRAKLEKLQATVEATGAGAFPTASPEAGFTAGSGEGVADIGEIDDGPRWLKDIDAEPARLTNDSGVRPVVPVIAGDVAYVANGWRVYAFDLASGTWRWSEPGGPRWDELAPSPRDKETLLAGADPQAPTAPAVANGVVVAPLLIPLKVNENFDYQGLAVTRVIPFRRLHAFEARTGALLWSHWSPTGLTHGGGALGAYRCAGPPAIAGDRVIAPVYTLVADGAINLQLAAFSLRTGELVWATHLVLGQRPINMFGRFLKEYDCGPPTIDGDRVYLSTDLGVLACVDVPTGALVWLSSYDAIPIPGSKQINVSTEPRASYWAAGPAVITPDLAIFTPSDSMYLIAVERDTGAVVSRLPAVEGRGAQQLMLRHLVGAVGDTLYVAGSAVAAYAIPGVASGRFVLRARSPEYLRDSPDARRDWPRPTLTANHVLVPLRDEIAVLGRLDLQKVRSIPYAKSSGDQRGNLASADGVLVSVAHPYVSGFFDVEAMVVSARSALVVQPRDPAVRMRLAQALRRRAEVRARAPREDLVASVQDLADAERVLADVDRSEEMRAQIAHARGLGLARRGDAVEAAAAFRRAFDLAREPRTRLEAGLELEKRLAADGPERTALVGTLEREFGSQRIDLGDWRNVPVSLYLTARRAELALPADPVGAVAAWQQVLARFPDERLGRLSAAAHARQRIAELIATHGRRVYATVEAEAAARLAAIGPDSPPEELARIPRLYPNSEAATVAACSRLDRLVAAGRALEVPVATLEYLRTDPPPEPRRKALLADAAALRELGNEALAARVAARAEGSLSSRASSPPRAASSPASLRREPEGPTAPLASAMARLPIPLTALVAPEVDDGSAPDLLLALQQDRFVALRAKSEAFDDVAWSVPVASLEREEDLRSDLSTGEGVSVLRGVVALADSASVQGIRAADGVTVFRRELGGVAEACAAAGGALVALVRSGDDSAMRLAAFDAVAGSPLWDARLETAGGSFRLVVSDVQVICVPTGGTSLRTVSRFDLATGEELTSVPLPADWDDESVKHVAVYGDRLVYCAVVRNRPYQRSVVGLDLAAGGATRWELSSEASKSEELKGVLFGPDRVYVLRKRGPKPNVPEENALLSISPATGETRELAALPRRSKIGGVQFDEVRRWRSPMVVAFADEQPSTSMQIVAVELANGRSWKRSIPTSVPLEVPPTPAVGRDLIAIGYASRSTRGANQNEIRIFRRADGEYAVDRVFSTNPQAVSALGTTSTSFVALAGAGQRPTLHRFFPGSPR
ncbi:MAG TPA: PQQ-binding-like beta-propeller repeat protein [Planctomycetota bacterium]|nr:PQQ-binding-like beta-propeller repeat protein [Planctomycetota bacterium]